MIVVNKADPYLVFSYYCTVYSVCQASLDRIGDTVLICTDYTLFVIAQTSMEHCFLQNECDFKGSISWHMVIYISELGSSHKSHKAIVSTADRERTGILPKHIKDIKEIYAHSQKERCQICHDQEEQGQYQA